MKNRDRVVRLAVLTLFLLTGLVIGRILRPPPLSPENLLVDEAGFRMWFWERRPFDLLAQVGLIFAGALGVAAVLPQLQESSISSGDTKTPENM